MKHRLRLHHWNNGMLEAIDHWFETLEEAVAFANESRAHHAKVYGSDGMLVHSAKPVAPTNSYA